MELSDHVGCNDQHVYRLLSERQMADRSNAEVGESDNRARLILCVLIKFSIVEKCRLQSYFLCVTIDTKAHGVYNRVRGSGDL